MGIDKNFSQESFRVFFYERSSQFIKCQKRGERERVIERMKKNSHRANNSQDGVRSFAQVSSRVVDQHLESTMYTCIKSKAKSEQYPVINIALLLPTLFGQSNHLEARNLTNANPSKTGSVMFDCARNNMQGRREFWKIVLRVFLS